MDEVKSLKVEKRERRRERWLGGRGGGGAFGWIE